jgi:hypothetical protein
MPLGKPTIISQAECLRYGDTGTILFLRSSGHETPLEISKKRE